MHSEGFKAGPVDTVYWQFEKKKSAVFEDNLYGVDV